MADATHSDTYHWLQSKFCSNEAWTLGSAISQYDSEVLRKSKECFVELPTQVKLKLLLSFFHIPRRNLEGWRVELEEILEIAIHDNVPWVSMLAETMKPYASTAKLNLEVMVPENSKIFYALINGVHDEITRLDAEDTEKKTSLFPMECLYLNKTALTSVIGDQSLIPRKAHFTLKKKPKPALLREELLLKASGEYPKKPSTTPVIPLRMRGMTPRIITDTTDKSPLKGLPSRPLQTWLSTASHEVTTSTSFVSRAQVGRKEGGVKLLKLEEQPVLFSRNKKQKKDKEDTKNVPTIEPIKESEVKSNEGEDTPAYAAGLSSEIPVPPTFSYQQPPTGATTQQLSWKKPFKDQNNSPSKPTTLNPYGVPNDQTLKVKTEEEKPPLTVEASGIQTKILVVQTPTHATRTVVTLSKALMDRAQEIFRTANKVSRPEKEHILKFMAGNRENPCPNLGSIVSIKLGDREENVRQEDGTTSTSVIETHFIMNYSSGEWKIVNKSTKQSLTSFFK